jgi:CheY-like chemotaxis protein
MEVPAGGGQTILVVEDDELVRPSVETLIESLGYRVLSARNGPDALEILRQDTPIDLLFTDVFMPGGMYGPKLVAEARRLRPELKVREIAQGPRQSHLKVKLDEAAKNLHSITSSAIASTPGGMVSPSALAVFRLMTSSNLVGCKTGRSAGLSPLRIRPV